VHSFYYCIKQQYCFRFVKAAHGTSKNHHLAKYFVDLSLIEYSMSHYRPSELSAAAICLSLYLLSSKKLHDIWTPTLSYYSGYTLGHIEPIIRKLAKIITNVENSKYKAVYNKYLDTTFAKVANLPQLKSEIIYELAKLAPSS
jgi:hypothetical protein